MAKGTSQLRSEGKRILFVHSIIKDILEDSYPDFDTLKSKRSILLAEGFASTSPLRTSTGTSVTVGDALKAKEEMFRK